MKIDSSGILCSAKIDSKGGVNKLFKNANLHCNQESFLECLSMTGNEDTYEVFGTPNCGKGEPNQVERVGHASPLCKFDKVQVFGGA